MLNFGGLYAENKAWELALFHKYRKLDDGLTVFELTIEHDWYKGDHNPRFEFSLRIFNWTIFEFNLYDTRHVEDEDGPEEVKIPCPHCGNDINARIEK